MDYRKSEGIWYEEEVAKCLKRAGYIDVQTTPASGDKGADLLWKHPDGTTFAGQCKYFSQGKKVDSQAVQAIHTAKDYFRRDKAVIFTSVELTGQADEMARKLKIEIIDRFNPAVNANRITKVGDAQVDVTHKTVTINNALQHTSTFNTANGANSSIPVQHITPRAKLLASQINEFVKASNNSFNKVNIATRLGEIKSKQNLQESLMDGFIEALSVACDIEVLKREGDKVLIMDPEGVITLCQYVNSPVVYSDVIISLDKMKNFFAGEQGCDDILVATPGTFNCPDIPRLGIKGGFLSGFYPDVYFLQTLRRIKKEIAVNSASNINDRVRAQFNFSKKPIEKTINRVCIKCGVIGTTQKLRFCPKCGLRLLSYVDGEAWYYRQRAEHASMQELVEGWMLYLTHGGNRIIHRDGPIAYAVHGQQLICHKYFDNIVSKDDVASLLEYIEEYRKRGLSPDGVQIVTAKTASPEAREVMVNARSLLSVYLRENTKLTCELVEKNYVD